MRLSALKMNSPKGELAEPIFLILYLSGYIPSVNVFVTDNILNEFSKLWGGESNTKYYVMNRNFHTIKYM